MAEVRPLPGESIDATLRRFRKAIEREGIKTSIRRHEFFESPSERRREKRAHVQLRRDK